MKKLILIGLVIVSNSLFSQKLIGNVTIVLRNFDINYHMKATSSKIDESGQLESSGINPNSGSFETCSWIKKLNDSTYVAELISNTHRLIKFSQGDKNKDFILILMGTEIYNGLEPQNAHIIIDFESEFSWADIRIDDYSRLFHKTGELLPLSIEFGP